MILSSPRIEYRKVETEQVPLYVARPSGGQEALRPGIIVLQEIFGVNVHIQDVTNRFAAAGYVAVSPDIFHRAGKWQAYNYTQMDESRAQVGLLSEEMVLSDIGVALKFLASQPGVDPNRIGVTGYCFGGRMSLITASVFNDQIKAATVYYGGGIASRQTNETWPVPPLDRVGQLKCPVHSFWGGLDKHIPREHVEAMDAALQEAGVEHAAYYYPYADHGFFCDARATYNPRAAQDAWWRTMGFFGRHLGPVPAVEWE